MRSTTRTAAIAWLIAAVYYFYQYMLRSAPAVMMPQLQDAFGLGALGVTSLVGLFYYGYSPFSLVAGVAMDSLGPREFVPIGAAYIATQNFPASRAATLIGATQMFGMAGGSAGQFIVGPLMGRGTPWQSFWIGMGVIGLVISVLLFMLLPKRSKTADGTRAA